MEISWIESVIYGFIAGLTEILPVSSHAHQNIMHSLFGLTDGLAFLRFSASVGAFVAFLFSMWPLYGRMQREYQISKTRRRNRSKTANMLYVFDWNIVKTACIPLIFGCLIYSAAIRWQSMVPLVSLLLVVNGFILHIPQHFAKGNKDSRTMSRLDGMLIGLASVLGYLPGISRIAAGLSVSSLRGADGQQSLKWSLLLSAPALMLALLVDIFAFMGSEVAAPDSKFLIKLIVTAATSCIGTSVGIGMIKKILTRNSAESFSYYCWGAALFSFILYLY